MDDKEKQVLLNRNKDYWESYVEDELKGFRTCLRWMCVEQSNLWRACLSWSLFFLLGILVPTLSHFCLACLECDATLHRPYDTVVQLSLTCLATVSYFYLTKIVRKYGLRKFLYLDKLCHESQRVRHGYTAQLDRSMRILVFFVLPCFAAEGAYKIWWYGSGATQIPFLGNVYASDAIAYVMELCSWLYRTTLFFIVCVIFRLVCYLQILQLQDFANVFREESDVSSVLKEHLRIKRHLRVISHRYRAYILSALVIVTASQLSSLLSTTRTNADLSIFRVGELALCSVTLMAGLFILLRSATKITHKAQSVTSLAAKWHICATLDSFDGTDGETPTAHVVSGAQLFVVNANGGESENDDASDEDDDLDNNRMMMPAYTHTISFQKRQALVTYFENNRAGITVFGFMLDRSSLHTIFTIELALVLWLLGKTIGIS